MRKQVRVPIPDEFIGKWCITDLYGTHASYDVIACGGMVFDTEEQAQAYHEHENYSETYNLVVKITKDYPVWQVEMYTCGLSVKGIKGLI